MLPEYDRHAETTPIPLVHYALSYAQNGWPVFPLHGKIPFEFLTPGQKSHGYKDATTDAEQIQTWWTLHPTASIGLATGERSGIIVVDIDPPQGYYSLKELQQKHAPLPETRRSSTASRGLHYFFQYPHDGNVYRNAVGLNNYEGVDIRATGGYVVLPPSRLYDRLSYKWAHEETPIAPLPDWLSDLMITERQQRALIPQGLRFARSPGEKWLSQALQKAREGNRNDVGFWLACLLRDDRIPEAEARRIVLTYANLAPQGSTKPPYTSKEAIASVRSAYSREPREPAKRIYP
ncbi:MAG TPA: bifunctional DNA primase/polymerase [Ktedonobacteraceae bacterium]|nr:bifunctional DNA primase/polymerase [Ktedonobacteraceae bacterium]